MLDFFERLIEEKFCESVEKRTGQKISFYMRYNKKEKRTTLERNANNYCVVFQLPFNEELTSTLGLTSSTIRFDGRCVLNKSQSIDDIIVLSYNDLKQALMDDGDEFLKMHLIELVDPEVAAIKKAEREEKEKVLKEKASSCEIVTKLTRDNTRNDMIYLLAMLNYDKEDNQFCWDAYNKDWDDFPGKPFLVSDNRAFYTYDENQYLVVSKNLYDVFFASQGNGFESCFSLTSPYRYITGAPLWNAHDGFYMVYLTNGDISKWSAIPGHKLKLPRMYCRAWGYKTVDGFKIGVHYGKSSELTNDRKTSRLFGDTSIRRESEIITEGKPIRFKKYKTFYDNINFNSGSIVASPCGGRNVESRCMEENFYNILSNIAEYKENLTFNPSMILLNGKLVLDQRLPKSRLHDGYFERMIERSLNYPDEPFRCDIFINGDIALSMKGGTRGETETNVMRIKVKGFDVFLEDMENERFIATLPDPFGASQ